MIQTLACGIAAIVATTGFLSAGRSGVLSADNPPGSLEILTDRCSGSVAVVDVGTAWEIPMLRNFSPDVNQPYSGPIPVSNRRLTWFCFDSKTSLTGPYSVEQSTCPSGTLHIEARLGPGRLLNIACLP